MLLNHRLTESLIGDYPGPRQYPSAYHWHRYRIRFLTSRIFDSGNRTIGPFIGDPGVGDDVVDMRCVVLGSEESDGYGSIEANGIIDLQDEEGPGWTDSMAGEGFNAGMRRVADCCNYFVILTGQVDHYKAEANAYRGRLSCQRTSRRISDLACQVLSSISACDQVDSNG